MCKDTNWCHCLLLIVCSFHWFATMQPPGGENRNPRRSNSDISWSTSSSLYDFSPLVADIICYLYKKRKNRTKKWLILFCIGYLSIFLSCFHEVFYWLFGSQVKSELKAGLLTPRTLGIAIEPQMFFQYYLICKMFFVGDNGTP